MVRVVGAMSVVAGVQIVKQPMLAMRMRDVELWEYRSAVPLSMERIPNILMVVVVGHAASPPLPTLAVFVRGSACGRTKPL